MRLDRLNTVAISQFLSQFFSGSPVFALPMLFREKGGEFIVGQITVPDSTEPLTATVLFLDAKGYQTTPDDVPQWSSSDESVATVESGADGLTATVTVGAPGAAVIAVESTETNTGTLVRAEGTVTVQPGDTVIGSVEFAAPETPTT